MKMSRRSVYACRAVLELARHHGEMPVKASEIAERRTIPAGYLEQLLQRLKGAGVVLSRRGAEGGYILSCHPGELTVAAVVAIMDGEVRAGDFGGAEGGDVVGTVLFSAGEAARRLLGGKTFAMLAAEETGV